MSGAHLAAAGVLVAAAALTGVGETPARRRLARLPAPVPGHAPAVRGTRRPPLRVAGAVLAGVAVAGLVGGWWGVAAGLGVAVAADRMLRRLQPRAVRAEREAAGADLPFALGLIAATLRAGAPVDQALATVAEALGGPLAARLRQVGRALAFGARPAEAWTVLADLPEAAPLVRAAVRTSDSGAALAGACLRCADALRADRDAGDEAAGQRAGVLVVLPLGCCFLPAFVLVGVVPTVMGVLDGVLR